MAEAGGAQGGIHLEVGVGMLVLVGGGFLHREGVGIGEVIEVAMIVEDTQVPVEMEVDEAILIVLGVGVGALIGGGVGVEVLLEGGGEAPRTVVMIAGVLRPGGESGREAGVAVIVGARLEGEIGV